MKFEYCVLGAGLMGKAIAYDLLQQSDTAEVILADNNAETLHSVETLCTTSPSLNRNKLKTKFINADDSRQIESIFKDVDAAVAAVHYKFNEGFTKAAIKTKTHLCDLGGNNAIVDAQFKLNEEAKKAGVSIIPDCGLAPGMVAVLVKWGVEKFEWVDTVKIRVGGLPQNPKNELKYERLFSVDGLINEYIEPVRLLRNGELKTIEPLIEIEEIEFPAPFGKLEAFTTSGGVSTLVETYKGRLKNLDYKTIRYPGHCEKLKALQKSGSFTREYFEKNLPVGENDVTLVKIIFEGVSKKHELVIVDKATKNPPHTAMMRTTAYPAAIISQMQARRQVTKMGVFPQEKCIPVNIFIDELKKREIIVHGLKQEEALLSF